MGNLPRLPGFREVLSMRRHILEPITWSRFEAGLELLDSYYRAYAVLIYYLGIRVSEALRLRKEDLRLDNGRLYIDVGIRLKTARKRKDGSTSKGKRTQPIPLDLEQPHVELLVSRWKHTRKGQLLFPFCRMTALRQISRAGLGYNHLSRLTAITDFLKAGRSIADVVNWFGISVQTVNNYIGSIDLEEMGSQRRDA